MSNGDEDRSSYSGHYEIEVIINRPVAAVWEQYLDLPSWITGRQIENIYGAPGTVGSIMRASDKTAKERGYPPPYYLYCKLIKLVPEGQYVLKTYSEKGGSYGMEMTCFEDTRFVGLDSRTRIRFNFFAQITGEAVAKDPTAVNLGDAREGMVKSFDNLKKIVESR